MLAKKSRYQNIACKDLFLAHKKNIMSYYLIREYLPYASVFDYVERMIVCSRSAEPLACNKIYGCAGNVTVCGLAVTLHNHGRRLGASTQGPGRDNLTSGCEAEVHKPSGCIASQDTFPEDYFSIPLIACSNVLEPGVKITAFDGFSMIQSRNPPISSSA